MQPFVNDYYAKYCVFSTITNIEAKEPLDGSTKLREGELLCSTLFPCLKFSTEYLKVDVTLQSQMWWLEELLQVLQTAQAHPAVTGFKDVRGAIISLSFWKYVSCDNQML